MFCSIELRIIYDFEIKSFIEYPANSLCQTSCWTLIRRILPSAEEDNLSPFDSNIACLCQSIEINNNMYVYMYVCMYVRMYGVWDPGFKSCIQQRNTTCLLSIWISLACARASKLTTTNMYVWMCVCMNICTYVCMYVYPHVHVHACMYTCT